MKSNIQNKIKDEYTKARRIANILMDKDVSFDKSKELRTIKDNCFKKIDFYKNLNKALQLTR